MSAPQPNAAATLAAMLRSGTPTQCCAQCDHARTRTGAQLVRCRRFDHLTRRTQLCDEFRARSGL